MFVQSKPITAKDLKRRDIIVIESGKELGLVYGCRDLNGQKELTYFPISVHRKGFPLTQTDRTIPLTNDQRKVLGFSFDHEYCVTLDLKGHVVNPEQEFLTSLKPIHTKIFINQCFDKFIELQEEESQPTIQPKAIRNRTPASKKARQSSGQANILDINIDDAVTAGIIDAHIAEQIDKTRLKNAYELAKDPSASLEEDMRQTLKAAWIEFTNRALKISGPPLPAGIVTSYPPSP